MNALIIQENGRHDKNRNFRECFSIKRSFEKLGYSASVWGLGHDNYHSGVNYDEYDIILNLENYSHTAGNWLPDLSNTKKPLKLLWAIDAHCIGQQIFENERERGKYDFLLHSTREYVAKDYHIWMPNSFDNTLIQPMPKIKKEHQLGFCGNYVNRKPLLDWLSREYGLKLDVSVIGNDMVKAVNSYKCHFNMNMNWNKDSAINYRNFETIGCETLLLTSHSEEYEHLGFIDGVNCFIYKSIKDMREKIDFIANNDVQYIAEAGFELSKKHSYTQRVEKLLQEIEA